MYEAVAYLSFQIFYNIELPPACFDLIHSLFNYTIKMFALLSYPISAIYSSNVSFYYSFDIAVKYKKVKKLGTWKIWG